MCTPSLPPPEDQVRRAASSDLKETAAYSTTPELRALEIRPDGRIVAALAVTLHAPNAASGTRAGFSAENLRELRMLVESDPRVEVRRAATAILHYALGGTLKASAAGTPYGVGWIRGLLKAIREEGIGALEARSYRQERRGSA